MVLEGLLVSILQRHLGQFLDSDLKELKTNLWKGKMSMKKVALRPDALYALGLPLSVKAGRIELLEIDIPWRRIGKEVSPRRKRSAATPCSHVLSPLSFFFAGRQGGDQDQRRDCCCW